MRIKFLLELPKGTIKIPVNYNQHLQDMIFSLISSRLAGYKNKDGIAFQKKHFSLFTFSKIYGDFEIKTEINRQKNIIFKTPIHFFVSTPYTDFLKELSNRIRRGIMVDIFRSQVCITDIELIPSPDFTQSSTLIRMLSPISMGIGTPPKGNEKNKDVLSPEEASFSNMIRQNLIDKYQSFAGQLPKPDDFAIQPVYFSERKNFHIIKFKDFTIKGYSGIYKISGSSLMQTFAFNCGLGERNAQGFGMFEIWNEEKKNSDQLNV